MSKIQLSIIWLVAALGLFGTAVLFEEAGIPVEKIGRLGIPGVDFAMVYSIIMIILITYLFDLK